MVMMALMLMVYQRVQHQAMNNKMRYEGDSTKISDSNDDNDEQSIINEQVDESTTSEDKNTLMETIIKQVNDALSASGMPDL